MDTKQHGWPLWLLALAGSAGAQNFDPPEAVDLDPDPHVVQVDLVAAETTWQFTPGVDTQVWTYNGTIPGPTIRANVGDLVRVRLQNDLPDDTTVHWHGIEVPADVDGSHISQRPVRPGESYQYEFRVLHDGFFWYHPHVRTFDQVEKGLYGGVVLTDAAFEASKGLDRIEEHLVFFDDVLLDAAGQLVPAFSFPDPLQNALYHVNGREGNVLLLNGRAVAGLSLDVPNGAPQRWRVLNAANTTFCRLDLTDADEGVRGPLWELGSDGGFLEAPFLRREVTSSFAGGGNPRLAGGPGNAGPAPASPSSSSSGGLHAAQAQVVHMQQGVLLFPGERMDVVFTPLGEDGEVFRVFQHDWFRGRHSAAFGPGGTIVLGDDPGDGLAPKQPVLDLVLQGPPASTTPYQPPATLRPMPDLRPSTGQIPVTFGHGDPDPDSGAVTLFAQADMSTGALVPLPAPKIDSFNAADVEVGETRDWVVTNLTHGDHPFHAHGFFFELISYEWQNDLDPTQNGIWRPTVRRKKDTIRTPARLGQKGSSRTITTLRVHFDDAGREDRVAAQGMLPTFAPDGSWTSGGWLFHCHVLEHSGKGMLSVLELHEPDETFRLLGKQKPGTGGAWPSLTATGELAAGASARFDLIDCLPGTKVWLVVGDAPGQRPIAGGTLVPTITPGNAGLPFLGVHAATADAAGRFTWSFDEWQSFPGGTRFWVQAAARDPGGLGSLSFSNALEFEAP